MQYLFGDQSSVRSIPESLRRCERGCRDISLELELYRSLHAGQVEAFQRAVTTNDNNTKRITTVKFHLHGDWQHVSLTKKHIVSQLVEAVSYLPCLKELVILGDFVPIPAVTNLLLNQLPSSNLQTLNLGEFRHLKTYDTYTLDAFCQAVQQSQTLKRVSVLPRITCNGCEPQEKTIVDLLLGALADLRGIQHVELVTNVGTVYGPALRRLCNSTTLVRLDLNPRRGVAVGDLKALTSNTSIQELLVSCAYSDDSSSAVTQLIANNHCITKLTLVFHKVWRDDNSYEQYVIPIARALDGNTRLSHVTISTRKGYPSEGVLRAMVSIFHTNVTLHYLDLFDDVSSAADGL